MKAIATLSLLGVALTHEDNELNVLSKLFNHKKHHPQQPQQPVHVPESLGEDFIIHPDLDLNSNDFPDYQFSVLSKLIHPKKKHPQPQQPQQPTPVQQQPHEEYIVHEYVPDNELSLFSKLFHKKKHPQPQPQPQPQPTPQPQPVREEFIVHPYVPDNQFFRYGIHHKLTGGAKEEKPQQKVVKTLKPVSNSSPQPHLPNGLFDDEELMTLPYRPQPILFPRPTPTFPERPILFEDDELMSLPYRPQPTWFPKPSPTFPEPHFPEDGFPIKKPVVFFDDNEFNAVVEEQAVEDEITLEAFLIECFGPVQGLTEDRDQLVQEVLDTVRDVLTPDEVDEQTLVAATEEFVDESLEINSYFKNHAN